MSHAVKVSEREMDALRDAAARHSRSIAGQAEHWMRLGRLVERSPGFNFQAADQALKRLDEGGADGMDAEFEGLMLASEFFDDQAVKGYAALGKARGAVGYNEAGELEKVDNKGRLTVVGR